MNVEKVEYIITYSNFFNYYEQGMSKSKLIVFMKVGINDGE